MEGSKERIDFITEYIAAYEAKIKLANKNGLFDEAHLFELFAQEICGLWYGKKFINLNTIKKNYPCVDLLSDDKEIYVQVSTQGDIPSKIRKTLDSLEETKYPELERITAPVFFVLSNDSETNVKDLVGENQIGRFPFTVKDNLISTSMIIQRSCADIEFQKKLYSLLKEEIEGVTNLSTSLLSIFDVSKNVGLSNIETMINREYEIDRSALINSIMTDSAQFKIVCGEAGSGKSAVCKKILMEEQRVFFARADKIATCNSISNIWDIDIVQSLKYLEDKRAIIYLDALEYISRASESTKELLQALLYEIKKHPGISFMASCRSCDIGAFIKLFGLFDIKKFVVEDISDDELSKIAHKYSVIKEMASSGKYVKLLRSPFYIDVIISKSISLDKAGDVNDFRDYIWKECICLNKKSTEKGLSTKDIVATIERMAVERSKRFMPGINDDEIDSEILEFLTSNNVVTVNDNLVRLKYDIYEDICFERLFDKKFDLCRGDYAAFFECIEDMGSGSYRRYQIWVSNKLLAKVNRDKFIKTLIFDNEISAEWSRNTIIGLVKSPYCKSFFDEQGTNIIKQSKLKDFINYINCFAFEMGGVYSLEYDSISVLRLKACGYGRLALIKIIFEKELYKDIQLEREIVKLCSDYVLRSKFREKEIDECSFEIVKYYIDSFLKNMPIERTDKDMDYLAPRLEIVYSLPKEANIWLRDFWGDLQKAYIEDETNTKAVERILEWTLDHVNTALIDEMYESVFKIAETIWLKTNKLDIMNYQMYGDGFSHDFQWGLRGVGKEYNSKHKDINNELFLRLIYQRKFKPALEWTISIINKMVKNYSLENPDSVSNVVLFNSIDQSEKSYIGSVEMWFSGREEYFVPTLIGDMVYWLRESAIHILHVLEEDNELFNNLASYIKKQILEKSNSIILLTVIEDIGFEFMDSLPGYSIDLASCLDLISWDIQWKAHSIMTPEKQLILEQIQLAVGIPGFNNRYATRDSYFRGIQHYMVWNQLTEEKDDIKDRCVRILEYLYSKIDSKDANALLQVQKMDMRDAGVRIIDNKYISIEPKLSEETQKIVDDNEKNNEPKNEVLVALKDVIEEENCLQNTKIQELIERLEDLMSSPETSIIYEDKYILSLCIALKGDELSKEKRMEYVDKWLDRIWNIFSGESYVADLKLTVALIAQYQKDLGYEVKNKLKKFMLFCLMHSGSNGQIDYLQNIVTKYLLNQPKAARIFFNTIICYANDEWNHVRYNKKIMKKCKGKQYRIPAGYGIPKPDEIIRAYGEKAYESKFEDIIEQYLYKEGELNIKNVKVTELDPGFLFIAMNTGLKLSDEDFLSFTKQVIPVFINELSKEKTDSIMDTYYQRYVFKKMLERELVEENGKYLEVVNLLFDNVDYHQFSMDTIKMYISIFERVGARYFDSYEDDNKRRQLRECLEYVEKAIDRISIPYVKKGMERILIFDFDRFGSNWNKCKTKYSYNDKLFLCRLWGKYQSGHEKEIVMSMYQMKIDELLPEILPVLSNVVIKLAETSEIADMDCEIILKSVILKALVDFSNTIKADIVFHNAYECILNTLIQCNDESAAVILDEYRTH